MKRILSIFVSALLLPALLSGGVVKKTKSEVSFKGMGKFTSQQEIRITGDKKMTDSKDKFKGEGILGKTLGSAFLKSGETGEIINLTEMMIYDLNHKAKEYKIRAIEKLEAGTDSGDVEAVQDEDTEEEESSIRIIKSEFGVNDTGEQKTINDFPCQKYIVTWLTEWENMETGEKGTDRLSTDVWATPLSDDLRQAQEQENQFNREYMKRLGFDVDELQQAILGTNWMSILSSVGQGGVQPRSGGTDFGSEMKKIEGYPVVIDGKYFAKREGGPADEKAEEGGGLKGKLGRFAKKAVSGDKKDSNEPAFTYYTEVIELDPASVGDDTFQVPAGYKKKD
ncbi:MAG: hypothetical protein WBB73_04745 [Candidatus Aminicenantaceae bacterium]